MAAAERTAPLQHREGIALTNQPDVISTGQLKRLAKLAPPEELLGTAKKRLYEMDKAVGTELKIQARLKRGNARCSWGLPQVRKHTTDKIQVLSSSLTQPLKEAIDSFRHMMSRLHPFERVVADVIVSNRERNGAMSLADALSQVKRLKSETGSALKDAAARAAQAGSTKELEEITLSCLSQVESLLGKHDSVLKVVRDYGRDLRRVPVLDLKLPTVVLVGSPNVGKSSLVRAISTGKPEVSDYAFTTRRMMLGHVLHPVLCFPQYQVLDTPGLLPRSDEERNSMEKLTLASMEHLPSAVVLFVLDLSATSGVKSTVTAQLMVRNELLERFGQRPWLDIVTKADLEPPRELAPHGALFVSCRGNTGIDELQERLMTLIPNVPTE